MSVELSKEIWDELKRYVNPQDREEAAETLVSVLIDNDVDAPNIKAVFKNDSEVKAALASYLKDHDEARRRLGSNTPAASQLSYM